MGPIITPELEERLLAEVDEPVRRFLRRLLHNPTEVEEAASRTWLALVEAIRRDRKVERPVSLALRIAWRKAVDELRVRRTEPLEDLQPALPDPVVLHDLCEWLKAGIARLAPEQRALLHLRYEEGLTEKEVARVLGQPAGTIARKLHDARQQLGAVLERIGGGRPSRLALALLPSLKRGATSLGEAIATLTPTTAPAWTLTGFVFGVLLMKKFLLGALAVLVVGIVIWSGLSPSPDESSRGSARSESSEVDVSTALSLGAARAEGEISPIVTEPFLDEDPVKRGHEIAGRVVSSAGEPVPLAEVIVVVSPLAARGLFDLEGDVSGGPPRASTSTNSLGMFVSATPPEFLVFDVLVRAEGFAPHQESGITVPSEDLTIVLERGWSIFGTVRDRSGAPIENAEVRYLTMLGAARFERSAKSREDGAYVLECLPARTVETHPDTRLEATASGFSSRRLQVNFLMRGGRAEDRELDIVMARGGIVEGRVTDARNGAPIAGADVVLFTNQNWSPAPFVVNRWTANALGSRVIERVRTDAEGRYRIENSPADVPDLVPLSWGGQGITRNSEGRSIAGGIVAWKEAFAPHRAELNAAVMEGESLQIDIALSNAIAAVEGRVVDEFGEPLAEVRVGHSAANHQSRVPGEPEPLGAWTETNEEGRYKLIYIPVGEAGISNLKVVACGCTFGLGTMSSESIELQPAELRTIPDLVLKVDRVRGVVVDENGKPIVGALVTFVKPPSQRVLTGTNGEFEILGLTQAQTAPKTRRWLEFSARGFTEAKVEAPFSSEPMHIKLEAGRNLKGQVVGVDGAVASAYAVEMSWSVEGGTQHERLIRLLSVDSNGRFLVEHAPKSSFTLNWRGTTLEVAPEVMGDVELRVNASTLETDLLQVRLVDPVTRKTSIRFARGTVYCGTPQVAYGIGELLLTAVPAGRFVLEIRADGLPLWSRTIDVEPPGRRTTVDVAIGRGPGLIVKLEGNSGQVPSDARVYVSDERKLDCVQVFSPNVDGIVEVQGLEPGRYRITAMEPKASRASVTSIEATIQSNSMTEVELKMQPVSKLRARLVSSVSNQTQGMSGAIMSLETADGRILAIATPSPFTSYFVLPRPELLCDLVVRVQGRNSARMTLDPAAGIPESLDVRVSPR